MQTIRNILCAVFTTIVLTANAWAGPGNLHWTSPPGRPYKGAPGQLHPTQLDTKFQIGTYYRRGSYPKNAAPNTKDKRVQNEAGIVGTIVWDPKEFIRASNNLRLGYSQETKYRTDFSRKTQAKQGLSENSDVKGTGRTLHLGTDLIIDIEVLNKLSWLAGIYVGGGGEITYSRISMKGTEKDGTNLKSIRKKFGEFDGGMFFRAGVFASTTRLKNNLTLRLGTEAIGPSSASSPATFGTGALSMDIK